MAELKNNPEGDLTDILIRIGGVKCIQMAASIRRSALPLLVLSFRNMDIDAAQLAVIMECIYRESNSGGAGATSISFSYNPKIGNEGAIAFAKYLPKTIREIGLVGCQIGDEGGLALLNSFRRLPNLKMVCIEGNSFTSEFRTFVDEFKRDNGQIYFMY